MPVRKREVARHMTKFHGLSVSRSCFDLHRTFYYRIPAHLTVKHAEIIVALASVVEGRPIRGFWKCRKMVRRLGHGWNYKVVTVFTSSWDLICASP